MTIDRTKLKDKTGFQYRYGTDDVVAVIITVRITEHSRL